MTLSLEIVDIAGRILVENGSNLPLIADTFAMSAMSAEARQPSPSFRERPWENVGREGEGGGGGQDRQDNEQNKAKLVERGAKIGHCAGQQTVSKENQQTNPKIRSVKRFRKTSNQPKRLFFNATNGQKPDSPLAARRA